MGDNGFCLGGSNQRAYMREGAPEVFAKARISLATAVKTAETASKGKAFDAAIDPGSNLARYRIKILKGGKISYMWIDAKTGAIVNNNSGRE